MNRRNFITELGIGLIAATSLKSFSDINDTWIPVLASDRENTNGRIYPLDVVISIKKQIESLVDKKLCFVSLCADETQVSSVVNLRNVSGLIDDVKFEHNGILFAGDPITPRHPLGNTPRRQPRQRRLRQGSSRSHRFGLR